jgi:hypothetical protein
MKTYDVKRFLAWSLFTEFKVQTALCPHIKILWESPLVLLWFHCHLEMSYNTGNALGLAVWTTWKATFEQRAHYKIRKSIFKA